MRVTDWSQRLGLWPHTSWRSRSPRKAHDSDMTDMSLHTIRLYSIAPIHPYWGAPERRRLATQSGCVAAPSASRLRDERCARTIYPPALEEELDTMPRGGPSGLARTLHAAWLSCAPIPRDANPAAIHLELEGDSEHCYASRMGLPLGSDREDTDEISYQHGFRQGIATAGGQTTGFAIGQYVILIPRVAVTFAQLSLQ